MRAVDRFTNMTEGFILDSDYEMLQYNVLLEIIERVEALENHLAKIDSVQTDILMMVNPAKPDLETKIAKAANDIWTSSHNVRDVEAHLRAFAKELGVG